ncbi:Hypothetical protein SLIV_21112 [Streptomyces lividans TK24]|uniref:Uncharacterized protein n=1 Tax=Streptomyces lividans TK24 TaxID=457428 RepID=A0ABX6TR20_STRLI|nr:Hypothetical protein SLIV_21112 [Streptomyces lividans TK24]QSJ10728.1 Hypothetical protein SLIVDG2_21112 [Streptomyces lividans]QTD71638.1 Hypothetical protein SLIVYQS_21112 [Streptomyces lividans TK24] [Streptomyces lividans]
MMTRTCTQLWRAA